MREPVGTRASNSPLGMSATTTSSDWSSVKSLMIGSPDSGKTTGCMVGLTSRCQGASQLPAVEMPASPPLIESQVTGPRVRDRLQGEPIFRPSWKPKRLNAVQRTAATAGGVIVAASSLAASELGFRSGRRKRRCLTGRAV